MFKHLVYLCCPGVRSPRACVPVLVLSTSAVQTARCGDVAVSDTVLRSSDPVVTQRYDSNGLVVRAPRGAVPISLDLGGVAAIGNSARGIYTRGRDLDTAGARNLGDRAPGVVSTTGRATR